MYIYTLSGNSAGHVGWRTTRNWRRLLLLLADVVAAPFFLTLSLFFALSLLGSHSLGCGAYVPRLLEAAAASRESAEKPASVAGLHRDEGQPLLLQLPLCAIDKSPAAVWPPLLLLLLLMLPCLIPAARRDARGARGRAHLVANLQAENSVREEEEEGRKTACRLLLTRGRRFMASTIFSRSQTRERKGFCVYVCVCVYVCFFL